MEITRQQAGDWVEMIVKGRLDGYWADHLTKALDEVVRGGSHRIRVNLSHVSYVSSMGLRVLVVFYQQLQGIHGKFVVSQPSEPVKRVLEMAKLGELLMPAESTTPPTVVEMGRLLDRPGAHYEVLPMAGGAGFRCRQVGEPGHLEGCRFGPDDSRTMLFPSTTVAVGLGAFGHTFDECQGRFGEFLAVSGAAAYQPTDGSNVADYLLAEGSFVPELQVLYGLACEGSFSHLARFEGRPEVGVPPLSEVAAAALDISGTEAAALVLIAESAGLLGAALRQSPAAAPAAGAPFQHPQIRQWLSFSAERVHPRSLAVVVGVASRSGAPLPATLRPLAPGGAWGHFHAAAFSYRPLRKGRLDLGATIRSLFEAETLQSVLHLLGDDREAGRESEFVRGACWVGPITEILT